MSMETLEKVWEAASGLFNGIGSSVERTITGLFGSSNARYIKKLQPTIAAINALEPRYQAMSDAELRAADRRSSKSGLPPAKRLTTS